MIETRILCLFSAATAAFVIALQYPIIPFLGRNLGASTSQIGQIFAVFPLGQAIGQPLCGRLADVFGRKPALVAHGISMAVVCLVFSIAASPRQLIFIAFLAGVCCSTWPVCRTVIVDMSPVHDVPRWLSAASAFMSAPYVVAPFLSGQIAVITGSYRLPFVVASVMATIVTILIVVFMHETRVERRNEASKASLSCTVDSLAHPITCVFCNAGIQGIQAAFLSSFTSLVSEAYGWGVGETSKAFSVFSIVMFVCAIVTTSHNSVMKLGLLKSSVLGAILIASSHVCASQLALPLNAFHGYAQLSLLMGTWCVGKVLSDPAFLFMSSDAVPKEIAGTFQGVMSGLGSLGAFAITATYHITAERASYRESMAAMAQTFCAALLILVSSVWLIREQKQSVQGRVLF